MPRLDVLQCPVRLQVDIVNVDRRCLKAFQLEDIYMAVAAECFCTTYETVNWRNPTRLDERGKGCSIPAEKKLDSYGCGG